MKAIRKVLATLTCLCLIIGCVSMTAFAAPATASITVQDQSGANATVAGKLLNLFKIFNATTSGSNISYTWITDQVGDETVNRYQGFFYGETVGDKTFNRLIPGTSAPSINDVVAYLSDLSHNALLFSQTAASLHTYIHEKGVAAYLYKNNDHTYSEQVPDNVTSYTFSGLELGYYMIYDATTIPENSPAVRSAAMLTHSGENKVIELKADRPHIYKFVNDNHGAGDPSWKLGTTASIGDTVSFRIETAIPDHALYGNDYTFVITDVMADELELDKNSIVVTITPPATVDDDQNATPAAAHYAVDYPANGSADFTVTLSNIKDLPAGTMVDVVYQATVTANATASNKENKNTATLTYSNDPNNSTYTGKVSASVSVWVWQVTLTKYLEGTDGTPSSMRLPGAEFEIRKVDGGNETTLKFSGDATTCQYVLDNSGTITTLKTLNDGEGNTDVGYTDGGHLGQLVIFGLGEGTYRIYETAAPDGYQQADHPFEFTLTDTIGQAGAVANAEISQISPEGPGQFTRVLVDESNMKYYLGVTNAPGSALPETGGMGTTLFTICGIVLMAGAVAFFTSRKRSSMA